MEIEIDGEMIYDYLSDCNQDVLDEYLRLSCFEDDYKVLDKLYKQEFIQAYEYDIYLEYITYLEQYPRSDKLYYKHKLFEIAKRVLNEFLDTNYFYILNHDIVTESERFQLHLKEIAEWSNRKNDPAY